jgi:hypothetical protein
MGLQAKEKQYSLSELREMMGILNIARKNDPASTTLTATPAHGLLHGSSTQYGVFSGAGVRPGRYSAAPRMGGLGQVITMERSRNINELIEIMTGVTDGAGNNATTFCGDPPIGGQLKVCRQNNTFGAVYIKTKLGDVTQVGQHRDYADVSAEVYNNAAVDNIFLPQVPGIDGLGDTESMLRTEMYTLGFQLERSIGKVNYLGTAGTQNSTYRGVMTQWGGLDALVKQGYTDAVSGSACPAADSVVTNFNADISGSDANSLDIIAAVTNTWRALKERASQVGMDGVTWVIAMRPEQFLRMVDVWACNYLTFQCAGTAASPLNRDAMATQALRVDLINGKYLLIDGEVVPVITDEGIALDRLGLNLFKADMYFLPLAWGGRPLLRGQFFDMGNEYANEWADFTGSDSRVINDGLYRVAKRSTGFCSEYLFAMKFRLILDASFLAGRIDDIRFSYYIQTRAADPAVTGLYQDGGNTYR